MPKTVFPGGALVGCEAGFLNTSRIKGSHAAIKTGMLCAEAAFEALTAGRQHDELSAYPLAFEQSWLHTGSCQAICRQKRSAQRGFLGIGAGSGVSGLR